MAIQINAEGLREAVAKHLATFDPNAGAKPGDPSKMSPEEEKQLPLLRDFLVSEVKNLADEFNFVKVVAQAVAHSKHRHIEVNIMPSKVHA